MPSTPANSLNLSGAAGVVSFNGTATVSTSAITQYDVLVGDASQAIANVAPSATSGVPLISQGASANPAFGTAVVGGGGTGVTTMTTAYAPVCAGTTATDALQVASTGLSTSGWVLTSTGASSLPTFQAPSVTAKVVIQIFFYTGGAQTYTPTTNMKYCQIVVIGSGGGGGGAAATSGTSYSAGSGAGGGETAIGLFSAASIGASQAVTINNRGTVSSGGNGGTGGTNSVGSLITAVGGSGGTAGTAVNAGTITNTAGGAGGTGGSGGTFRFAGGSGGYGFATPTAILIVGGAGGTSYYSTGAASLCCKSGANAGSAATGYGGGGGGAENNNSAAASSGGVGSTGIVVITEYI